jgi:hypothetical protein
MTLQFLVGVRWSGVALHAHVVEQGVVRLLLSILGYYLLNSSCFCKQGMMPLWAFKIDVIQSHSVHQLRFGSSIVGAFFNSLLEKLVRRRLSHRHGEPTTELYMLGSKTANVSNAQHIDDFLSLAVPMKKLLHPHCFRTAHYDWENAQVYLHIAYELS